MKSNFADLVKDMDEKSEYSDEIQEQLEKALSEFKEKGTW
jgi:F0F1-type ATP synthase alpha subunit